MVRIKHRYLLINILYPGETATELKIGTNAVPDIVQFRRPSPSMLDQNTLSKLIRNGVSELFGDYGAGKIGGSLKIMYMSTATSTAIVRVSRDFYRLVWAALTFVTRLPHPLQTPCVIQVIRVSGTVRKSEEAAIAFAKALLRRVRHDADSESGSRLAFLAESAAQEEHRDVGIEDEDDESGMEVD